MGLAAGSQEGEGGSPAGTKACRVGVSIWPPGHSWGSQGSAGWCLPLPGLWPLMSLLASLSFPWCVCQVDSFGRSYWLAPAGIWLLGGAQGRGPFSLGVCAWGAVRIPLWPRRSRRLWRRSGGRTSAGAGLFGVNSHKQPGPSWLRTMEMCSL